MFLVGLFLHEVHAVLRFSLQAENIAVICLEHSNAQSDFE